MSEGSKREQSVNIDDEVGRASRVLAAIIIEKRHRQDRMHDQVAAVLEDFPRGPRIG